MHVAVMGCVVNGPGESKQANIGISLPGSGETPVAPVYVDGEKTVTLKGERIAEEFQTDRRRLRAARYGDAPGRTAARPERIEHRLSTCAASVSAQHEQNDPGGPRDERHPAGRGAAWESFEDTVRGWLRSYGYRNIRMPMLERTELFVRSIGEVTDIVEKEMYTFVDQLNGENLTLRPEGTASCVRAAHRAQSAVQRSAAGCSTSGRCSATSGRRRAATASSTRSASRRWASAGPDVDAEHMVMCARLWNDLGLDGIALEINTLGSAEARARYRTRLVAYLEQHRERLDEDSRRRLHTNPLRVLDSKNPAMQAMIEGAPRLLDDLDEDFAQAFRGGAGHAARI